MLNQDEKHWPKILALGIEIFVFTGQLCKLNF